MKRNPLGLLGLLMIAAGILGCGPSRPETATVTGKVTFHGRAVPDGTIMFYPEKGRPASGTVGPDGTYTLTTFDDGDGALVGKHVVTIEAVRYASGPQPKSLEEEIAMAKSGSAVQPAPPQWLVPPQYSARETSGLSAEVKSGSNEIDFALP